MQKWFVPLVITAILVLVAGCAQEAPSEQPPATVPTPAVKETALPHTSLPTAVTTRVTTLSDSDTIIITKDTFSPDTLTVKVGSEIRWQNGDSSEDQTRYNPTHRIRIANIKDSQLLSPGQSWSWTFRNAGVFDYSDMIHTSMHGTITVVE